jgi:hypothetical protein
VSNEILRLTATTGTNSAYQTINNTGGAFTIGRENSTGGAFGVTPYASVLFSGGAYPMVFATQNIERLRIDSAGKVGIGTSGPGQTLTIDGTLPIAELRSGGYLMLRPTENNYDMRLQAMAGNKLGIFSGGDLTNPIATFVNGGNVGIGTTSPDSNLSVFGNAAVAANVGGEVAIGGFYDGSSKISYASISGVNQDGTGNTSGQLLIKTRTNFGSLTERMRINSAGNVGIGTSSPLGKLDVVVGDVAPASSGDMSTGVIIETSFGSRALNIGVNNTAGYSWINAAFSNNSSVPDNLVLMTGATERMRIDSSGNLLVGTTSAFTSDSAIHVAVASVSKGAWVSNTGTTTGRLHMRFENPNGSVGSISTSGSATSFNTSSDYRLKEDWQPMTGASERVKALKPVNFAWKADGSRVDGFLAHEAQEVVPECVTGEKDAVDKDGKPNYQGIDQSKLVPLLTAALQEALTKIDALTARLDAANL